MYESHELRKCLDALFITNLIHMLRITTTPNLGTEAILFFFFTLLRLARDKTRLMLEELV